MVGGSAARRKLLVIDDDPNWRSLYRLEFGDRYDVVEAADGHEGLDKLEATVPDLVILDLNMPRLDGVRFLACMDDRGVNTPVIVCSALEAEARRLAGPSVRVVSKSPDLTELSLAIVNLAPAFR
jgi:DNA-binding response OmpR family regulator